MGWVGPPHRSAGLELLVEDRAGLEVPLAVFLHELVLKMPIGAEFRLALGIVVAELEPIGYRLGVVAVDR